MATPKLNINLSRPRSVKAQEQLVAFARSHRKQALAAVNQWLKDKLSQCNGDSNLEMWYREDADTMKAIIKTPSDYGAFDMYCNQDTLVRDWFSAIAETVYLSAKSKS